MATIYRFVIEQRMVGRGTYAANSENPRANKGAAKKGRDLPLLWGGSRGGTHHNRKLRAINPLMNRITGGIWERGVRITRAVGGLVRINTETGKLSFGGTAVAILIAFVLMTIWNSITKWNQQERARADKLNAENYKKLENGGGAIHGAYKVMVNGWSGRITYNENK